MVERPGHVHPQPARVTGAVARAGGDALPIAAEHYPQPVPFITLSVASPQSRPVRFAPMGRLAR